MSGTQSSDNRSWVRRLERKPQSIWSVPRRTVLLGKTEKANWIRTIRRQSGKAGTGLREDRLQLNAVVVSITM